MKTILASLTSLTILVLVTAVANAQTEDADAAMEEALNDYSAVSLGWYVNQRCWFVTGDGREKFNRDLELINVALLRDLGRADRLREIQRGAQFGAQRPPYNACGEEAEEITTATARHAGLWSDAIRELVARLAAQQAEQQAKQQAQPEAGAE